MASSKNDARTRVLERPGAAPSLVLRRARFDVVTGKDRGKTILLEKPSLSIGTDPTNDAVLGDPSVSGRHVEVSLDDKGCLVRDLGSTNGTSIDGYLVREIYLKDGAEIVLGETTLRFVVSKDEVEIPLSTKTNVCDLLGHSAPMRAAFAILERAAASDTTVLIQGESGTGKELAARALHTLSTRREGPYLIFDCGASSPTLIESQLFGHAKGAFTGALDARAGVFEEGAGGTVVLDEIGELPLDLQPKLLRAVEARTVQRIGEVAPRPVDVRLVASTHRNLEEEVRAGRFRQDLYFRLSVITVRLPALRERKEEIPRLVQHFMSKLGARSHATPPKRVLDMMMSYSWPGNVRELRNVVERMILLPDLEPSAYLPAQLPAGPSPEEPSAPLIMDPALPFHEAKRQWTERFERDYLSRLIQAHGGNISEVARVAGISRQSCYRLMEKHGLRGT